MSKSNHLRHAFLGAPKDRKYQKKYVPGEVWIEMMSGSVDFQITKYLLNIALLSLQLEPYLKLISNIFVL